MDTSMIASFAGQWAAGVVLLIGGAAKLHSRSAASAKIARAVPVSPRAAAPVTMAVIVVEIAVGLGLWMGVALASLLGTLLFAGFGLVGAHTLRSGRQAEACGCLGDAVPLETSAVGVVLTASFAPVLAFAAVTQPPGLDAVITSAGAGMGLLLVCSSTLLGVCYWLALYALTVLRTMQEARSA